MKRTWRLAFLILLLCVCFYAWNRPGIGGQVLSSPNDKLSAWISHKGVAGINGQYVLTIADKATSEQIQEYKFTCSTDEFAMMRETPERYLLWSTDGNTVTLKIPNEYVISITTK